MLRVLFLGIAVLLSISNYSQKKSINDYKYIIVPASYSFFSKADEYQLNSLSKFLFNKYGFNAFMRGEDFPEELKQNGCMGLTADVKKNSGLFVTKLSIALTDCNGIVVFSSREGVSREKEYKQAYHQALRKAFKDVERLNYKYNEEIHKNTGNEIINKKETAVSTAKKPIPVVKSISITDQQKPSISQDKSELSIKKASSLEASSYVFNDIVFVFQKRGYGFELFRNDKDGRISIGKIFKSGSGTNYIVKAGDYSGNGYFDAYGNFVLERINPVTNKLITDIFGRQ